MFYCAACAVKNGWPDDLWLPGSRGPCEVCHEVAACFDVPSRWLPIPGKTMDETREIEAKIETAVRRAKTEERSDG